MDCTHCPAEIGERLARIETTLERVDKAVSGNGQPGLIQRVASLELWRSGIAAVLAFLLAAGGLVASMLK